MSYFAGFILTWSRSSVHMAVPGCTEAVPCRGEEAASLMAELAYARLKCAGVCGLEMPNTGLGRGAVG